MKKFLLMIAVALFTTATYAQLWTSEISSIKEDEMGDYSVAAMDKDGNLYVTGVQDKNFQFAGKEVASEIGSFIAKYNVNGDELFAFAFQGYVMIDAITTDAESNFYVAGNYEDFAIITDAKGEQTEIGSEEATGAYIAKYDANGNLLAVKTFEAEVKLESFFDEIWQEEVFGINGLPYYGYGASVSIDKIVVEGSKVYALFEYTGDVAVEDITLTANYKLAWGMYYIDASNIAVVSFDSTLSNAANEASITVAETCADASEVNSFNFAVEGDNLYVAAYGMGNLVLTTSAGSEAFDFQTTEDESGNVEMGAIVAVAGKKAVKFSNELYGGYGDNVIAAIDVVNGKICLTGTFEGTCAFDNSKVATEGALDLFVTSIDADELTADWVYTSANVEISGEKYYEVVADVVFGKENIFVVSFVEYAANEEDYVYECRNYAVSYDGVVKMNEPIEATAIAYNENNVAFIMAEYTVKVSMYGTEVTNSIEAVNAETENNTIYDLTGRRVENATKGIYIIGGKKVLVK